MRRGDFSKEERGEIYFKRTLFIVRRAGDRLVRLGPRLPAVQRAIDHLPPSFYWSPVAPISRFICDLFDTLN